MPRLAELAAAAHVGDGIDAAVVEPQPQHRRKVGSALADPAATASAARIPFSGGICSPPALAWRPSARGAAAIGVIAAWPGLFWGGIGLGLGIGAVGYYGAHPYYGAYPYYGYYYDAPDNIAGPGYPTVEPAGGMRSGQLVPQTRAADPIFYPKNGQSMATTESDRRECNRWATTQPGRDGRRQHLPARDLRLHGRARLRCR